MALAAPVPADIPHRPYSVYPSANLITPDGFFITNLGLQFVELHVKNEKNGNLANVRVYIEGFSDPHIVPFLEYQNLGDIPKDASVPTRFLADFKDATPGFVWVSFIVESDGHEFKRIIKKIYVTRLDYNENTKTVSVYAPEGRMDVRIKRSIIDRKHSRCHGKPSPKDPIILLPTHMTFEWFPDPPYEGKRGPYPFEDPWWKVLVFVAAFIVLLAIAAAVDYFSDGEFDGASVVVSGGDIPPAPDGYYDQGGPDEDGNFCCDEIVDKIPQKDDEIGVGASASGDNTVEKVAYGLVGPGALAIAGYCDAIEPHFRGQENTVCPKGEFTISEKVEAWVRYSHPPVPGTKYKLDVRFDYTRFTTSGEDHYSVDFETQSNRYYLESYEVEAPSIHDRRDGPLRVKARFKKPDGSYYKGSDLRVFGVLVSSYDAVRVFDMADHGMELDEKPEDSWYTGGYTFGMKTRGKPGYESPDEDLPGIWYVYVFAQNVNTVPEGTDPFDAGKVVGGMMFTPRMKLGFGEPCELLHDHVVQIL